MRFKVREGERRGLLMDDIRLSVDNADIRVKERGHKIIVVIKRR